MIEKAGTKVYSAKGIVEKISNSDIYLPGKSLDGNDGLTTGTVVNIRTEEGIERIIEYPYVMDNKERKKLGGSLVEFICIVTNQESHDNGYRKASLEYELKVYDGNEVIRWSMLKPITRVVEERYLK